MIILLSFSKTFLKGIVNISSKIEIKTAHEFRPIKMEEAGEYKHIICNVENFMGTYKLVIVGDTTTI